MFAADVVSYFLEDSIILVPPPLAWVTWVALRLLVPCSLMLVAMVMWALYHTHLTDPASDLPLPPGGMGLPLIGETLAFIMGPRKFFSSRRQSHGPVYKTHILGMPTIRVTGAEHVRKVLMSEHSLVQGFWPRSTQVLLGPYSLATSLGDIHKTRRRAIQKVFSYGALEGYVGLMQKTISARLATWCSATDHVLGYLECKRLTFAVACEAILGIRVTQQDQDELLRIFEVFEGNIFSLPYNVPGSGLHRGYAARKVILTTIEEALQEKQRKLAEVGSDVSEPMDAMTHLLVNSSKTEALSLDVISEMALELLFAGYSTTSSALTSMLVQLGQHPEVITKLRAELEEHQLLCPQEGDLDLRSLGRLQYVDCVTKELLRVAPPVGGGFRRVVQTFSLGGYQIPAGWTISYGISGTHEEAQVFTEGASFCPDRWMDHKAQDYKFHYLPFSAGPRTCVGKEFAKLLIKVFTVECVRSSRWTMVNDNVNMSTFPVPHPVDGLPLRFSEAKAA